MSDHFIRPDNDTEPTPAEFNTLADEYQLGLQKMITSGYEEFGPQILRQHKMVITALRAYAAPESKKSGADFLHKCLLCGRAIGDHSMDTADICNAFIGGSK